VNIIEKGGRLMGDFQINYCALTRTFKKCTYGAPDLSMAN
jgi:hypothetical protein